MSRKTPSNIVQDALGLIGSNRGLSTPQTNIDMKVEGNIERIRPRHYKLLESWYAARGRKIDTSTFSDMGFIVDGRAAGFLYVTNSNLAMIEGIVADPYTIPSHRRLSIEKLVGLLMDTALSLGFTNIFGISKHPAIIKVGKKYGFKIHTDFLMLTYSEDKE